MTPEEALKIDPARYSVHGDVATALRVLQNALREAQAAVVQMREDAMKKRRIERLLPDRPAARTYDDGVRDAAKAAEGMAEMLRGTVAGEGARSAVGAIERLLSPAPAVAPVIHEKTECASCSHVATHWDRFSSGIKSGIAELCCGGPGCCEGGRTLGCMLDPLHPVAPVAAPKPGPTTFTDATGTKWSAPAEHAPQVVRGVSDYPSVAKRFDAEAALVTFREAFTNDPFLTNAIDKALAAGRGAR